MGKSSLYDYLYEWAITAPGNVVMFIGFALIEYDLFPGGGILTYSKLYRLFSYVMHHQNKRGLVFDPSWSEIGIDINRYAFACELGAVWNKGLELGVFLSFISYLN